jgi:hypothetical protein
MLPKISLHFQQLPGWAKANLGALVPDWPKIIDPPSENPFPGRNVIGRTYMDDGPSNALVAKGSDGAYVWSAQFDAAYRKSPWIYAWEGPNEPHCQTPAERAAVNAFYLRFAQIMHGWGLRAAGPCFSTFQPPPGTVHEMADAIAALDLFDVHEYDRPNMRTHEGEGCLRYRTTWAELAVVGVNPKPTLISECGLDDGEHHGWKTFAQNNIYTYADQLAWYASELAKSPYILAADVFTAGSSGWDDFDVSLDLWQEVHKRGGVIIPPVVEPPVTPPPGGNMDPRADNAKGFHLGSDGKVDGVMLSYFERPETKYQLVSAELIGEADAGGNTVATVSVLDKNNIPKATTVYLCYPWEGHGFDSKFANMLRPGNSALPIQHVITNKYPSTLATGGPLAICVGGSGGNVDSDVIGGLGLPDARHVSYALTFKERGAVVVPPVEPPDEPPVTPPDDGTLATAYLAEIVTQLKRLNAHLGAG